jgi:hypothetical protein
MFLFLGGILIAAGVVIAHWFSGTFSLGGLRRRLLEALPA